MILSFMEGLFIVSSMETGEKIFVRALKGEKTERVPFWFMRQAGRYLPEYRELRMRAGGFLQMVYDPQTACEITLQPVRRFGMDAAILFSDILVVPQAMGVDLAFTEGEGPRLEALRDLSRLPVFDGDAFDSVLSPVFETVRQVRRGLEAEGFGDRALIGFAGAPWTIACYMIEGGGSRDFLRTRHLALSQPEAFEALIALLTQATIRYLSHQIRAGAEAVQIFDSWAGVLDGESFARWAIAPIEKIASALHAAFPDVPVIGFPRGAGVSYAAFACDAGVDAVALDSFVPCDWAARSVQTRVPVQGNLDPVALLAGGSAMECAAHKILGAFCSRPFVFNLGHGVIKETPVAHVSRLCDIVREWKP